MGHFLIALGGDSNLLPDDTPVVVRLTKELNYRLRENEFVVVPPRIQVKIVIHAKNKLSENRRF